MKAFQLSRFSVAWAARAQPGLALRSTLAFVPAAHPYGALTSHVSPASPPMPLARWLATRSRSTTAGSTPTTPKEAPSATKKGGGGDAKRAVLVKVGDDAGPFYLFKDPGALDMDGMSLLEALAGTKGFASHLAGVALHRCTVHVCASASLKAPSPKEAEAAEALEGAETLRMLTATAPPVANLFVHVRLPKTMRTSEAARLAPTTSDYAAARQLLEALRAAQPEAIPNGKSGASLLRLPPGVDWLQLGDAPLFVRSFYRDCFEGPLESLKPGRRFTIIGNAGIGKSAFGEYLLWQAVRAGRTAVYVSDKAIGCTILYADGQAELLPKAEFSDVLPVLRDPSTVLIYDGDGEGKGSPPIVAATTVLVTSPKRSRFKEFEKEGGDLMFFPVFSRAEIDDLLEAAFPALHSPEGRAGVWERYDLWGGIPRYVLKQTSAAAQRGLPSALSSFRIDKLALILGHTGNAGTFFEEDSAISHRLFHLKPRGEAENGFVGGATAEAYLLHRTEMASPAVKEMMYTTMLMQHAEDLNKLLALPTNHPSMAKFIADAFETHALRTLSSGGQFEAFDPSDKTPTTLTLQPSVRHFFSNVEELGSASAAATASKLPTTFIPKAKNFAAIDAVLPGNILVNATLDKYHTLLMQGERPENGVVPLCDKLGIGGP